MTTEEKLENDEEKREKEMEHEICVVTWNVNNSSAHYDFFCDMIQCQADVVMCQETQHWHDDGSAKEMGSRKEGQQLLSERRM